MMNLVVLLTTHQQLHQYLPLLAAWLLLLHQPLHTSAPRGSQQKRRRIGRGEELDDAICEGLRESRKRWERKAEAEAAEKNAEMYFGKNVGETLRLAKRPLPKPGFSRCCWRWSSLHNNPTSLPSHSTSNYFGTYSNYEL